MSGRTDTASRIIAAPPERLFDAFMNERAQTQWLPPKGMTARFDHFEPCAGGRYRMTLTYRGGKGGKTTADSDTVSGRFIEVERPLRIVQTADFASDDPAFAGMMTMTWTFEPVAHGTQVTVSASDVPEGISAADHQAGLNGSLANLAAFVEAPNPPAS